MKTNKIYFNSPFVTYLQSESLVHLKLRFVFYNQNVECITISFRYKHGTPNSQYVYRLVYFVSETVR